MALGRSTDLSVDINGDAAGLERALKSAENATTRAQNATQRYDADLRKLESDLMKLQKSLDDEVAAALQRQHDAMDKTGKGMLVFGAAVATGLTLAGREAMKWESSWTGVTKTVDGSEQQMALLEEQLRGLARTLPATHTEIAAVAEAAGQLGVQRSAIAGFTKTMVDLAETTNLTADEAATSIAQFMNVMKTAPDEVSNIGSALVALGNAGASTEAEIMSMAQRLSGAGALVGASESDVLALASAMADLGIESELGGGAMSRAITKLYSAVTSGGPKLEGFARIAGTTAEEFAQSFREDPVQAVDTFVKGLGRIKASGGDVVAALNSVKISGTQDLSVLLRLAGAGDRITNSLDLSSDAWAENMALVEEANKRYATSEAKVEIAMNTLRDGAIDIGGTVLPVLASLAESVANVATFFGGLPGPVTATITILAALAAATALAGGAFMVAVPKVAAFKVAVDGLQAGALKSAGTRLMGMGALLTGPWGLALVGATAALGIFAAQAGETKRKIDGVAATLDQQTAAITDNTRAWMVKELSDSGAFESARRLGISLGDVTDAALGNEEALLRVNAALREQAPDALGAGEGFAHFNVTLSQTEKDGQRVAESVQNLGENLDAAKVKSKDMAAAMGGQKKATDDAATGAGALDGAMADLGATTGDTTAEVKTLGEELQDLTGNFLNNREAARAVREQTRDIRDRMRELVKEHGAVRDANGKLNDAFARGTKVGDEVAGMLDDLAQRYQDQIDAVQRATGSEEKAQAAYDRSFNQLKKLARQLGMGKDAAKEYAEAALGVPDIVSEVRTPGMARALAELDKLRYDILNLPDGKIIIDTVGGVARRPGQLGRIPERADGGPVRRGETYLVGERGPELYVPDGNGRIVPNHDLVGPLSGGDVRYGSPVTVAPSAGRGGAGIDYDRLASVMERTRPLYGDVHLQPHDYNQFRREMDEDRRRAAVGGTRGGGRR